MMKFLMESQMLQVGLVLAAVVGLLYVVSMYYGKEDYMDIVQEVARADDPTKDKYAYQDTSETSPEKKTVEMNALVDAATKMAEVSADPQDLLPKYDEEDAWARSNPETSGTVHSQNFLEAGHHYGENTQLSSMKNASLDIRSTPPIPKEPVSIWNNSTIQPDHHRKHFEIGASLDQLPGAY